MDGVDLTGMAPRLNPASAVTTDSTPDGPGIKSTAANQFYSGNATPAFTDFTLGHSQFWRGLVLGNSSGFAAFTQVTYTSTAISPFIVAVIGADSVGDLAGGLIDIQWNHGGAGVALTANAATVGMNNLGATFKVGGNTTVYQQGVQTAQTAFGAGVPTFVTPQICISGDPTANTRFTNAVTCCAYFWNRELTADEMKTLHLRPYSFINPAEYELPAINLPAAAFIDAWALGRNVAIEGFAS